MSYPLKIAICVVFGYLLGSFSPSALVSKLKKKDLRREGTGNLGATNTMLVMGKAFGALVLLVDMAKGFLAVRIPGWVFPGAPLLGIIAGTAAVFGHVFPFYMKFKGGKGLAAYAGFLLGADPLLFLVLAGIAFVLIFTVNYSAAMPMYGGIAFPLCYGLKHHDPIGGVICAAAGILIIVKHFGNVIKAIKGEDHKVRETFLKLFIKKKKQPAESPAAPDDLGDPGDPGAPGSPAAPDASGSSAFPDDTAARADSASPDDSAAPNASVASGDYAASGSPDTVDKR